MKVQQNFIHYILPIFFMCGAAFLYAESVQAASDNVLVTEFPPSLQSYNDGENSIINISSFTDT